MKGVTLGNGLVVWSFGVGHTYMVRLNDSCFQAGNYAFLVDNALLYVFSTRAL